MRDNELRDRGMAMGRFMPDGLRELVDWLRSALPGTAVPADALVARLEPLLSAGPQLHRDSVAAPPGAPVTWRERLWTVPAETRLGVRDVAEAIGRPRSWIYRRTGEKCPNARLPHRRLDGELVFLAGELRTWLDSHEIIMAAPVVRLTRARSSRAVSKGSTS